MACREDLTAMPLRTPISLGKCRKLYIGDRKEEGDVELPGVVDIPMEPRSLCLIELR